MKNLLLLLTIFILQSCSEPNLKKMERMEQEIEQLNKKLDSISSFSSTIKEKDYWFDNEVDGFELLHSGISEPDEFIKNALRNKTELIPFDAVLGGTMRFGKIELLSSKWLIAEFDDGHIYGKALYKYELTKKGKIKFDVWDKINPYE